MFLYQMSTNLFKLSILSRCPKGCVRRLRGGREGIPGRGAVQWVPDLHVLPPLPAVEVAGGSTCHLQDLPHVPRAGQGRLRGGLRLSGMLSCVVIVYRFEVGFFGILLLHVVEESLWSHNGILISHRLYKAPFGVLSCAFSGFRP